MNKLWSDPNDIDNTGDNDDKSEIKEYDPNRKF